MQIIYLGDKLSEMTMTIFWKKQKKKKKKKKKIINLTSAEFAHRVVKTEVNFHPNLNKIKT